MIESFTQLFELFHGVASEDGNVDTALERSRYLHLELHFLVAVFLVRHLLDVGDLVVFVVSGEAHQC